MARIVMCIDSDPVKLRNLEAATKKVGTTPILFKALEPAFEYLKKYRVDAIITGMGYPYREGDMDSFESNAGDILLILLKSQRKEIPVWGNAEEEFNKGIGYPFYKGKMSEETLEKMYNLRKGHGN